MASLPKSFIDHVTLWMRWRWFLIGIVFCAALLTAVVSSLMPKTYRSTAIVLPPFEGGTALPFLGGVSVDIFGGNEIPVSGLATLLKSRSLKDRVHSRIDLKEHYKKDILEKAYSAFEDHLDVEIEGEESFGAVSVVAFKIHVLDRDPEFCARLLNVVIEEWDRLCVELNRRGAMLRRQFVEENLLETSADLAAAEDSLRSLKERYGIASLEAQVEGTVTSAVALEQKITETRITIQVLEKLFQRSHPDLQRARLELQGLLQEQKKLRVAESGEGLLIPLDIAPEISLAFARQYRKVKTLEVIHEVLVRQYEQARIQELKDTPTLRIVDRGKVPEYKYKPKRIILVFIASLSAFFFAVLAMYFLNYVAQAKGSEEYSWIEEVIAHLENDLKRLKRLLRLGRN